MRTMSDLLSEARRAVNSVYGIAISKEAKIPIVIALIQAHSHESLAQSVEEAIKKLTTGNGIRVTHY